MAMTNHPFRCLPPTSTVSKLTPFVLVFLVFACWESTQFLSLGPFPIDPMILHKRLFQVSQEKTGFRSLLRLFKDIYLPLSLPIYNTLLPLISSRRRGVDEDTTNKTINSCLNAESGPYEEF